MTKQEMVDNISDTNMMIHRLKESIYHFRLLSKRKNNISRIQEFQKSISDCQHIIIDKKAKLKQLKIELDKLNSEV